MVCNPCLRLLIMLLSVLPDFDQRTPHVAPVRKPSRIVWQQRYEGVAVVAYQGGKAVACISGPWSSKYVLTWWEPMPGGQLPEPGGWNRIQVEVENLEATVSQLREQGARFRNDIVVGIGGNQVLLEDPSGNPIELFQPA